MRRFRCVGVLVLGALLACSGDDAKETPPAVLPPTARIDLVEMLQQDLAAPRHPGDGGGHVALVEGGEVVAGQTGRWAFEFTAGPEGIDVGGMLLFQVSPFWEWSPPQNVEPERLGFTTFARDTQDGGALTVQVLDDGLIGARIDERPLATGEVVRIVYGAGPAGARADRYAEQASTFWFAVDADGDGVRKLLTSCPSITVRPGPAAQIVAHLPSIARPGDTVRLVVAALDATGNAGTPLPGPVEVLDAADGLVVGPSVTPPGAPTGAVELPVTVGAPGIHRLRVRSGSHEVLTNPLQVAVDAPAILWGDLHGHSALSDGTGEPADFFAYARHVAGLDVACLTDHDHWGMRPLDATPTAQATIEAAAAAANDPGTFVALRGYEWTSWIHGHRHVLFFDGRPADVLSSLDPSTDDPAGLWAALAGREALTIPHHTAGGPIATNWDIPPDPRFEPVTEVVSVHGSSEAEDSPARIYSAVRGHFARDALDRGYQLGFIGSGDSHDGHPGLAHLVAPTGGLVAFVGADPSPGSLLAALRARRVYATSGPRIILRFAVDETPMGATVEADGDREHDAFLDVIGTAPLERVELVRSGAVVVTRSDFDSPEATLTTTLAPLASGEYVYARVIQRDGGLAWSSPVFAR